MPPEPRDELAFFLAQGPDGSIDMKRDHAEGVRATHPRGVLYNAPWETPFDGFAEHARRLARALADAGCPVHLRSTTPHLAPSDDEDYEVSLQKAYGDLAHASIGQYSVQVHQVVPTEGLLFAMVRHRFLTREELLAVNSLRVISTVWERSPVPASDVEAMNQVGQVWVACEANRELLASWGVRTPIRVVPVPFYPDDPHLRLFGRKRKPGPTRFYHIGKWEPRKAQDQILRAFLLAFRPGEAEIHLKTSPFSPVMEGYPEPRAMVLGLVKEAAIAANGWRQDHLPGVNLYPKVLPPKQLVALHALGDVYVTLSRGEGFDMPAFDAKLAGNFLVYTPSGGPQDFAWPGDLLVPQQGQVPCHPFYGWKDASYMGFRIEDAVQRFRDAHALVQGGVTPSQAYAASWRERFSAKSVGARMVENLREIQPELY